MTISTAHIREPITDAVSTFRLVSTTTYHILRGYEMVSGDHRVGNKKIFGTPTLWGILNYGVMYIFYGGSDCVVRLSVLNGGR